MPEQPQTQTEPANIVAFLCQWCTYAGADLAGSSRMEYPVDARTIRLPCSGRVDPLFVLKALQQGADAVLVSGCHPGDCHYSEGNYYARRRLGLLRTLLDFIGMDPRKLRLEWCSAAEAKEFRHIMTELADDVRRMKAEADANG